MSRRRNTCNAQIFEGLTCTYEKSLGSMEIKIIDDELEKFIFSLTKQTQAKVLRTIDLLEKFGNDLGLPHSKKITKELFELRIRGQEEIRITYAFVHKAAILLYGFKKKSQSISKRDLNASRRKYQQLFLDDT